MVNHHFTDLCRTALTTSGAGDGVFLYSGTDPLAADPSAIIIRADGSWTTMTS